MVSKELEERSLEPAIASGIRQRRLVIPRMQFGPGRLARDHRGSWGTAGTSGDPRDRGDEGGWGRYVISTYEKFINFSLVLMGNSGRAGDDGG